MGSVVVCAKVPAELAERFDRLAGPSRSAALRALIEAYVSDAEKPATDICTHPEPWVELASGKFCTECRTRVA